jgi:hypothetical protein
MSDIERSTSTCMVDRPNLDRINLDLFTICMVDRPNLDRINLDLFTICTWLIFARIPKE